MSPLDARWPFLMRPYTGMTPRALREAVYARAILGGDVEPHLDAVGSEHRARMAAALRSAGVVVRHARPTVTVRDRASVLDYRPARPAHHVANEGQVLILAADGTVSQAPVPVGDAE